MKNRSSTWQKSQFQQYLTIHLTGIIPHFNMVYLKAEATKKISETQITTGIYILLMMQLDCQLLDKEFLTPGPLQYISAHLYLGKLYLVTHIFNVDICDIMWTFCHIKFTNIRLGTFSVSATILLIQCGITVTSTSA